MSKHETSAPILEQENWMIYYSWYAKSYAHNYRNKNKWMDVMDGLGLTAFWASKQRLYHTGV